jgi:hypothetical protein
MGDRKLLLALCLSPLDVAQGIELLKLWADMEDSFNPYITVAVCIRFDMEIPRDINGKILSYVRNKFKVITHRVTRKGVGWPAGCNALEIGTYEWFVEGTRTGRLDFDYLMIAEADTIPLRKWWAVEIMNEAYDNRAKILGAYFTKEEGCAHINGNCVLHKDTWKSIKGIWQVPSRRGWDCFIGPKALVIGTPSRLIWQDYRLGAPDNPWKGDDYIFEPKRYGGPRNPLYGQVLQPCFLHGIKTLDGINAVRRRFLQKPLDIESQ